MSLSLTCRTLAGGGCGSCADADAGGRRYDATGQAPAAAPAATPPAAPPPSNFTHWGTDFSFLFDGYVDGNFNNPDSGFNQLRNFDFRADTLHVNMGKITIDHAPGSARLSPGCGFRRNLRRDPFHRPRARRVQILRAGLCQLEAEILAWRGGGCRRVRDRRGRGGHRDQSELELLAVAAVCAGPSPTTISASASRFPSGRISPAASRWCRAGTTSTTTTAARPMA